jgi:hypothetical protein
MMLRHPTSGLDATVKGINESAMEFYKYECLFTGGPDYQNFRQEDEPPK